MQNVKILQCIKMTAPQAVQKFLYTYANTSQNFPIISALVDSSRRNTSINESLTERGAGKKRKVRLDFILPDCDDTGSCGANLCDAAGRELEITTQFYDLSKCTASPVYLFNVEKVRDIDGIEGNELFLRQMSSNLVAVRKKLATQITAFLVANVGRFADGSESKRTVLVDPSTGILRPYSANELRRTYTDMQMNDPFLVGNASIFHAQQGLGSTTVSGAQPFFPNAYYDALVSQAYGGGEHIITWDPAFLKFVTYNKNVGQFATNYKGLNLQDAYQSGDEYIHATILDPVTRLLWDFNAIYDKCTKAWKINFELEWDIFFLPQTTCQPAWVNGILHWTGCDPVEMECPETNALPPAAPVAYAWTPSGEALPEFVDVLTVGEKEFKPEVQANTVADWAAILNGLGIGNFTVVSGSIRYNGYSALSGTYNGNAFSFATV